MAEVEPDFELFAFRPARIQPSELSVELTLLLSGMVEGLARADSARLEGLAERWAEGGEFEIDELDPEDAAEQWPGSPIWHGRHGRRGVTCS